MGPLKKHDYEPVAVDEGVPKSHHPNTKGFGLQLLQWMIILILCVNILSAIATMLATQRILQSAAELGALPVDIATLSRPDPFIGLPIE